MAKAIITIDDNNEAGTINMKLTFGEEPSTKETVHLLGNHLMRTARELALASDKGGVVSEGYTPVTPTTTH